MIWLVLLTTIWWVGIAADPEECYFEKTNFGGGDLKNFVVEDMEKENCFKACKRYKECQALTYQPSKGRCYLKTNKHNNPNTNKNYVSAKMECLLAAETAEGRETGKTVKYEVDHLTSGARQNDGGSETGYFYVVVGSTGETLEHECVSSRKNGESGSCSFEDDTIIGDVIGLKVINGRDDEWKFTKMVLRADGVALPSYYGLKTVKNFKSVSITFSDDAESCYLTKHDQWGGDIVSFNTLKKEKEECYEACKRHPQCTAFTMQINGGSRCYLKHDGHRSPTYHQNAATARMDCFREKSEPAAESDFVNAAKLGNVTVAQSGVKSGGAAERAIDGNYNTRWELAGCSYSSNSNLNWWEITLDKFYTIDHVIIYGLSTKWNNDEGILNGAYLLIGGQICEVISGMKEDPTEGHRLNCKDNASKRNGKVIRIENWYKKLVICEIEIMVKKDMVEETDFPTADPSEKDGQEIEEFFNVAYKKPASQTSTHSEAIANKAVDGWAIQEWRGKDGSCTHTKDRKWDHWSVNLGRVYQIDHIRVWGQNSNTGSSYMLGAMLWVDKNLCGRLSDMKKNGPEKVKCADALMAGSSITISHTNQYVSICEVQVMVKKALINLEPQAITWPGEMVGDYTNVALNNQAVNKVDTAEQSSTHGDYYARRANDGNRNGRLGDRSVTHTGRSGLQYWKVDLGRVYKIDHLILFGRTDCCSDRIEGARVIVGKNQLVADNIQKPTKAADPIEIDLSEDGAIYGRTVTVQLLNEHLSLAEVEVWVANSDLFEDEMPTVLPTWENVALKGVATQSSTHSEQTAARAVDNFPKQLNPGAGSCSHTELEVINWWEVDLGKEYFIDHIKVLGRSDNYNSAKRIDMATIMLDGRTIGGFVFQNQYDPFLFPLGGVKGRVVRIIKLNNYLTLCEVQVMVNHEFEPYEDHVDPIKMENNLASSAKVSSSSSMFGGIPALLTDRDIESNFFHGSCFFAGPFQNHNWVKLDLDKSTKIGRVFLYPRLDYYAMEGIDGAVVRAGDHTCGAIVYQPGALIYEIDCKGSAATTELTVSKIGWLSFCEIVVQEDA